MPRQWKRVLPLFFTLLCFATLRTAFVPGPQAEETRTRRVLPWDLAVPGQPFRRDCVMPATAAWIVTYLGATEPASAYQLGLSPLGLFGGAIGILLTAVLVNAFARTKPESRSTATSGVCPMAGAFVRGLPRSADNFHGALLVTSEKLMDQNDTHFVSEGEEGLTICTGKDAGHILGHPSVIKPDDSHPFDKSCTQALDILCSNDDLWKRLVSTHPFTQVEKDGTKWVDLWCEKNYTYFIETIDKIIDDAIEKGKSGEWVPWQKTVEKCYYNGFCMMNYGKAPEEMPGFVTYEEYRQFIEWVDDHGKLATNYTTPSAEMTEKALPTRAKLESMLGEMWEDAKATEGKNLRPFTFLHKLASDPNIRDAHSHGEVVAMLISMWWSGNFSASVGCSNTVYGISLLSKQDGGKTLAKLRGEVDGARSYPELVKSDTLDTCCRESLRWRSPVLGTFRKVARTPCPVLYEKTLPVGHMVHLTPRGCHANTDYWGDDVGVYNPDRWTPEKKQEYPLVSDGPHYWPFGYGERRCIGAEMAQFFLRATVSRVVTRTEFEFEGHWDQWILFGTSQPLKIQGRFVKRSDKVPSTGV